MAPGKNRQVFDGVGTSPIVQAIALAESGTTGEIRVHLSKRPFERSPLSRATQLFEQFGMSLTHQHNGVLLYVNLRRRKFAIVADTGITAAAGPRYWDQLGRSLRENLLATHPEHAIALAVQEIGNVLRKHFPSDLNPARSEENT